MSCTSMRCLKTILIPCSQATTPSIANIFTPLITRSPATCSPTMIGPTLTGQTSSAGQKQSSTAASCICSQGMGPIPMRHPTIGVWLKMRSGGLQDERKIRLRLASETGRRLPRSRKIKEHLCRSVTGFKRLDNGYAHPSSPALVKTMAVV